MYPYLYRLLLGTRGHSVYLFPKITTPFSMFWIGVYNPSFHYASLTSDLGPLRPVRVFSLVSLTLVLSSSPEPPLLIKPLFYVFQTYKTYTQRVFLASLSLKFGSDPFPYPPQSLSLSLRTYCLQSPKWWISKDSSSVEIVRIDSLSDMILKGSYILSRYLLNLIGPSTLHPVEIPGDRGP